MADAAWGHLDRVALVKKIKTWGVELGFSELGVSPAEVSAATSAIVKDPDVREAGAALGEAAKDGGAAISKAASAAAEAARNRERADANAAEAKN